MRDAVVVVTAAAGGRFVGSYGCGWRWRLGWIWLLSKRDGSEEIGVIIGLLRGVVVMVAGEKCGFGRLHRGGVVFAPSMVPTSNTSGPANDPGLLGL